MSAVAAPEPGVATPPPVNGRLGRVEGYLLGLEPGDYVSVAGVTWDEYERLMEFRDEHRASVRMAYHRGRLLLMPVGGEHERWKKIIARLLETFATARDLPLVGGGNMTVSRRSAESGLEPDECYYVQQAVQMQAIRKLDFETDPPPDLALEIEMTRGAAGKLPIYAALGVPEVWRWDGETLTILHRTAAGEYTAQPTSLALPTLPPDVLASYLRRAGTVSDTTLSRELFAWATAPTPPETA